jgi:hypothetical protein
MCNKDSKRTNHCRIKNQAQPREIEHEQLHNFFENIWSSEEPIFEELSSTIYKLSTSVHEGMKVKLMKELSDIIKKY